MRETATSTPVGVVNLSFVKKLFKPGENPIGHHFGTGPEHAGDFEIVGGMMREPLCSRPLIP